MTQGKEAMEAGVASFLGGDLPSARRHLDEAASAFIRANASAGGPFLDLVALIPILGRTPDTVRIMAAAGSQVAQAGSLIADAVDRLPGGLGALGPHGGRFDLDRLEGLGPAIAAASAQVHRAAELFRLSPRAWVLGPVAGARDDMATPLARLDVALAAATQVADALPDLLGDGKARRYFVAAQNPAELRGTGGFIGSYSILTAANGRLRFSSFEPIETLPDAVGQVKAPNPDYRKRYRRFGGPGYWRNINVAPDFPSVAQAIERLYRRVKGVRLDGAIAADPQSLAALLRATGPVSVPSLSTVLTDETVVAYTTNTAYTEITDNDLRKRVLGDAAEATFDEFMLGVGDPIEAVRSLVEAVAMGHLQFHSVEPRLQEALIAAAASGALLPAGGDYVSFFTTNAGANKVDFYARRSLEYRVELQPDGDARTHLAVTIENDAPRRGQPPYVIGPHPGASAAGEQVSFVSTYCSARCELEGHEVNGRPATVGPGVELGHPVFSEYVRVPAGETARLAYDFSVPGAWEGDDITGSYGLTLQAQLSTIRPDRATVVIQAPPGMRIAATSEPMEVDGSVAVWRGPIGKIRTLSVAFEKPFVPRAWARFTRFLFRPIL